MVKTNTATLPTAPGKTLANPNDIRAIKAPVRIPNVWLWVVAGSVLLLAAAALAWWWRRRRRQAVVPPPVPIVPPHERARARLQEALALLDQPRPFCILVSDTIRTYVEERFRLHAPERTTEEFLEELQSSPLLSFEQKQRLGEFLGRCDLVKFARYEPGPPELQGIYDAAVRMIDETQPPPPIAGPVDSPSDVARSP